MGTSTREKLSYRTTWAPKPKSGKSIQKSVSADPAKAKGRPKGKGGRSKKRKESYAIYIYKVLQTSPPGHWGVVQGNEYYELVRERPLRADCCRGQPPRSLQQEVHHHIQGDPDRSEAAFARGVI